MKFLILGVGGVGGTMAGFLAHAKEDVTVLARGNTYALLKQNGLTLKSDLLGEKNYDNITFRTKEELNEVADVLFVCVKQYSNNDILEVIEKASDEHTLIIPIQNGFGNGPALAGKVKKGIVLDGAIYVAAHIESPGVVVQSGGLFKVVYGLLGADAGNKELIARCEALQERLRQGQVVGKFSDDITRDTMQKFTFISSMAATGLFFDAAAGAIQEDEEKYSFFLETNREILRIADAMGIVFTVDVLEKNKESMAKLGKNVTASLQKDIAVGKSSEFPDIIGKVVDLGKEYGVETPCFDKVLEKYAHLCV